MTQREPLYFAHPEPVVTGEPLVPFFLPFAGCPGRCVFCDQHRQTGLGPVVWEQVAKELRARVEQRTGSFGLGFFGGTFTGLPQTWQDRLLATIQPLRQDGRLRHVRISTRPDMVDPAGLEHLRGLGVSMIELGVQTFARSVLDNSGRGYGPEAARKACRMVRDAGLELGIQLLPGLPGHDQQLWREDVDWVLQLKPAVVRVYPCVVMAGTELAGMYRQGRYSPWSLDMAVSEVGWAVLRFWQAGIRVIRLGLAAEKGMLDAMLAGPWHPAFGNMVRARALLHLLQDKVGGIDPSWSELRVPQRCAGDFWGHGRGNAAALASLGIDKSRVCFWDQPQFAVIWEKE